MMLMTDSRSYDEICSYNDLTLVRYKSLGTLMFELHRDGKLLQKFMLNIQHFRKLKEMLLGGKLTDLSLECLSLANQLASFYVQKTDLLKLVNGKLQVTERVREYLKKKYAFVCFARALGIPNVMVLNMARAYNCCEEAIEVNNFILYGLELNERWIYIEGAFALDPRFRMSVSCSRTWLGTKTIVYRRLSVDDGLKTEFVSMKALAKYGAFALLGWITDLDMALKIVIVLMELSRLVKAICREDMPSNIKAKWKWILHSEKGERGLGKFANIIRNWKSE
jgi:hypothetical protein